jgi:arginase
MADDTAQDGWDLVVAPWHLDERIPSFPVPAGGAELACPPVPAGSELDRMTLRNQAVADAVAGARRPLLLSGDCTVGLGAVAGLQRRHRQVAVVWLDAHGDFNTPAITVSGYLAGMSLAMLTGRVPGLNHDLLGLRPVADGEVVLVDARDLDPAERDALTASQLHRVPADPDVISAAVAGLGQRPVYLHVDVDVIDGPQLPGLRFPVDAGPAFRRVEDCLAAIVTAAHVTAAGIACAWLPEHINDPATREAIARLAGSLGARLAWQEASAV